MVSGARVSGWATIGSRSADEQTRQVGYFGTVIEPFDESG